MIIPDFHIDNKKVQYKFYISSDLFNDTALCKIEAKYNKYLFLIDHKDFKTKIIYNEDNINVDFLTFFDEEQNKRVNYSHDNITNVYMDDGTAICYISDKNMNWYLIKIDKDNEDGSINCITEKVQDENDVNQIDDEIVELD